MNKIKKLFITSYLSLFATGNFSCESNNKNRPTENNSLTDSITYVVHSVDNDSVGFDSLVSKYESEHGRLQTMNNKPESPKPN